MKLVNIYESCTMGVKFQIQKIQNPILSSSEMTSYQIKSQVSYANHRRQNLIPARVRWIELCIKKIIDDRFSN